MLGVSPSWVQKWGELVHTVNKPSEKIGDSPKTKLKKTVYNVWGFKSNDWRKLVVESIVETFLLSASVSSNLKKQKA
ncbi:hypothetical protein DRO19_00555 [Candidatus Bathyarchaeota archaeon]|nr:MAG: hypothetical protein DRO19_00555 [Candidatus Bathyarchaeota archaeon]